MTLEEAQKVAYAIGIADGGCGQCVGDICDELNKAFGVLIWEATDGANDSMDRCHVEVISQPVATGSEA